jgi:hypothetical protein
MVPIAAQREGDLAGIGIDGKSLMLRERGRNNREWSGEKKDCCEGPHGSSPKCVSYRF